MKSTNRIETPLYALFFGLSILLGRFAIMPAHVSCFISGALVGSGFIFLVASLLPQAIYENMPYRKWIESRTTN